MVTPGRTGGRSRVAGQMQQAAVGDAQPVEAGSARIGPVLAEHADPHVDQARVEVVGAMSPFLHGPGPEILADHVGLGGQPSEEVLAFFGPQVAGAHCRPRPSTAQKSE